MIVVEVLGGVSGGEVPRDVEDAGHVGVFAAHGPQNVGGNHRFLRLVGVFLDFLFIFQLRKRRLHAQH